MADGRRNVARYIAGAIVLLIVAVLGLLMLPDSTPVRPRFTISKQTTYLTGPLRAGGLIDYRAALNAECSRGVTPENNAVVLLFHVVTSSDVLGGERAEYFKKLGVSEPPDTDEYLFRRSELESGDQGNELSNELQKAIDRPWTRTELPKLAEWLDAKKSLLQLAVEATKRPRYYSPLVGSDDPAPMLSVLLPAAQQSRGVSRALIARGMLALGERRFDDASQDALACHRLGRLVGQGQCLVEMLVSITIEGMAEDLDVAILRSNRLTKAQCKQFAADLRGLPPLPDLVHIVDVFERCSLLDAILSTADKGAKSLTAENAKGGFHRLLARFDAANHGDWDDALLLANQFFDEFVSAASKPSFAERQRGEQTWDAHVHQQNSAIQRGETGDDRSKRAVKKLPLMLLPAMLQAAEPRERISQRLELLQVAFALAAYRADQGAYPPKLAELVGGYTSRIPSDMFNGRPLHYEAKDGGFVLYSVGPSLRDDGGRDHDSDPPGDNIAIRVGPTNP